ncbi:MAG: hypothetical protein JWL75_110 [Parcubacteria group bacterium]|nr:hypothetical protein [Parcubacteria group bacterium]
MELPIEFTELYRHWSGHVARPARTTATEVFEDIALFDAISAFIRLRISIWDKKYRGEKAPYTDDPILRKYRFCNMFREFDRQTIEFHTLLNPIRNDFPLWLLNMFYFRMVARTQTVQDVGLLSFDVDENEALQKRFLASPRPRYGTPYVFPVSTIMRSATPTRETFITEYLPSIMQTVAKEIISWKKLSVAEGVQKILPLFGFNLHFLWTEVLIDVAYQFPEYLDLFKTFPVGPGSLPTMRRINSATEPSELAVRLGELSFDSGICINGAPIVLSAENWEGVGCEFRKYTNLSEGKGRKRLYKQSTISI